MSSPLKDVWVALDHVQLAIPPDSEAACREFYVGILGMAEVEKPANLAKRGGLWLRTRNVQIHLGVDADFHPARKAHPAIVASDVTAIAVSTESRSCSDIKTWFMIVDLIRASIPVDPRRANSLMHEVRLRLRLNSKTRSQSARSNG